MGPPEIFSSFVKFHSSSQWIKDSVAYATIHAGKWFQALVARLLGTFFK